MHNEYRKKIILKNGFCAQEIKKAGFDGFFSSFIDRRQTKEEAKQARENGLLFWGLHAPFRKVNGLWTDDGDGFCRDFTECVDVAAECGIRRVMTHLTYSSLPPPYTEKGGKLWLSLLAYAREKGVAVSVENMEKTQHVLQIFALGGCGLCYDSGHAHAYTPTEDWLVSFAPDCLHLHDNYGMSGNEANGEKDDLHLLPYDGSIDWNAVCAALRARGYQGALTLEVKKSRSDRYRALTNDEYLALAFCRAETLSKLIWD